MANRPTGPEQGEDVPDPTQPLAAAPTATPAPAEPVGDQAPAQPAWAAASAAPQPGPPGATPSPRPPGGARRAWAEATSSTGGRVAVGLAAVLAVLLVVAVVGVGVLGVHALGRGGEMAGRDGGIGREDGRHAANDGPMGGQGRDRDRDDQQGEGRQRGQDDQQGQRRQGGQGQGPGQGRGGSAQPGQGLRQGSGAMMGGMTGLDDVLHGEFTTAATGTPVVMVVQVGEVTALTAGKSVAVKSSDGFAATYDLSAGYASTRIGLPLEVGAQVRVVAAKEGLVATRLNVLG